MRYAGAKFKVEKRIALTGKLPSGVRVGQVWVNVEPKLRPKRRAVAERIAINARIDHDDAVRVRAI